MGERDRERDGNLTRRLRGDLERRRPLSAGITMVRGDRERLRLSDGIITVRGDLERLRLSDGITTVRGDLERLRLSDGNTTVRGDLLRERLRPSDGSTTVRGDLLRERLRPSDGRTIVQGDWLRERRLLPLGGAKTTLSGLLLLLRDLLDSPGTIICRRSDRGLRLSPEVGMTIGLGVRLSRLRLRRRSSSRLLVPQLNDPFERSEAHDYPQ